MAELCRCMQSSNSIASERLVGAKRCQASEWGMHKSGRTITVGTVSDGVHQVPMVHVSGAFAIILAVVGLVTAVTPATLNFKSPSDSSASPDIVW